MEVNVEILKKALEIIHNKEREESYIRDCIKARLCPVCGKATIVFGKMKYKVDKDIAYTTPRYKCDSCKWEKQWSE